MRVTFATRIFGPEVSAASGILRTWAEEFRDRGADVTVLTAKPPRGAIIDDPPGINVLRAAVKRDRQQYVRGYLSYLSFDIPLAFRLLFSRRADLYVVEPPPTTVAVVRVIAALRRTPYVVRAADYWSEAAELVTSNRLILGTLRRLEKWGLRGASMLFTAHEPLTHRLEEVGIDTPAIPIGFGADTKDFRYEGQSPSEFPLFIYAGTHSEWHGAAIFIEAMQHVIEASPRARLAFYGNGEGKDSMQKRAAELGIADAIEFHAPIPPALLSPILAGATASVASLAPVPANDYALATKVYSSIAAGCPVIYVGHGPTVAFLTEAEHPVIGVAVDYDADSAAAAMIAAASDPMQPRARAELSEWSAGRYSLASIAKRVVDESIAITRSVKRPTPHTH